MLTNPASWRGQPRASATWSVVPTLKRLALTIALVVGVAGFGAASTAMATSVYVPVGKQGVPKTAPVVLPNGDEYVFFRGNYDQLNSWHWDGTTWNHQTWGGINAVSGDPAAIVTSTGAVEVYVRTTGGQIGQWRITSNSSQYAVHGAANVGGSPTAVADATGAAHVFFRMTNGVLGRWWFNGPSGSFTQWGSATVDGNPLAVQDANGVVEVLHRTLNGTMARWRFVGNGGSHAVTYQPDDVGTDPAAVVTDGTTVNAFYQTSFGQIGRWWFDAASWSNTVWIGSSSWYGYRPTVVATPNGWLDVFYRATNGKLGRYRFTSTKGSASVTGPLDSVLGEPSAVVNGDRVRVFFVGTDQRIWNYSYEPGASWSSWAVVE